MRLPEVRLKRLGAGLLGAGLLGLLLGTSGMAKAQDTRDEAKPAQQEEPKQDEAKPPKQEEPKDAKPPKEQEPAKSDNAKPAKNETQDEKQNDVKQNNETKPEKTQDRPQGNNGTDHANGAAAPQRGQRIPDDKFRAHFGHQHTFRVQTTVVEGQSRFQYGGYGFALVDPWPVGWAYTEDCYIDFIDGEYVLIDLSHPGVQIAVFVVM
jgi:hypothetical protein